MTKIFITGIAGFMGSHLSHYLKNKGQEIVGVDNYFHACKLKPAGLVHNVDIRDKEAMEQIIKEFKPDIIIHLAAQIHVDYSIQHPQETLDINAGGTINILETVRKYNKGIKIIVASTSEIYGSSQETFMDEKHQLDCQSPYGASKVAADRLAKAYIDTYDMNIVIIRNFNAFGPYQNDGSYGSVIARFTKAALAGKALKIYGSGRQSRDYMYIDDIIQAYEFAYQTLSSGVYNFGTGKAYTINYIAKKIKRLTKSKSVVDHIEPRSGEVQRLCSDIKKVQLYGFKPTTDFDRDLKRYIDWYKEQK